MARNILARFFWVSKPANPGIDFHEVLKIANECGGVQKRERDIAGSISIRLERYSPEDDFITGEFCRKQTDGIPPSAGPKGLTVINLPQGDGLGHLAAFAYHIPTRCMLLEVNKMSATASRIPLYIKAISPGRIFLLEPVLRKDAIRRFDGKEIKKLRIVFAKPNNLGALEKAGDSAASSARKLAEAYDGLNVELIVSVGQDRKSFLDKIAVGRTIRSLLGGGDEPKHLEVMAQGDNGSDPIDFIKESLTVDSTLDIAGKSIDQIYTMRKDFLYQAFRDNLDYLEDVYRE